MHVLRGQNFSGWRDDFTHETQEHKKTRTISLNIFNYQGKYFPTGSRIFPPLQRSPINNFIVKGLGRIHKGAQSFPSSRRAEVPRPPTPPPGHLPLLSFSNVTRWRFQLLYGASPSGQPGGEWGHRAQHKKWSWSRSLLSKTREKLQAASSSAAHPPRGPSLPQHHAGKSSGGLSP